MSSDARISEVTEIGRRNASVMPLIANWCGHARLVVEGGVGLVEQMSGLPIAPRRVTCQYERARAQSSMHLANNALDFYDRNCVGCQYRLPVGFPNLSELVSARDAIRAKLNPNPVDVSVVMEGIGKLLDVSITGAKMPTTSGGLLDLSKIDFDALAKRFNKSKAKNTDLEILKAAIRAQLEKMIGLNKTRADYADKFEELIESYNRGSRNIEDLFNELIALSRALNNEQQRHVRESMSEEELVIFDLLTRPAPELSPEERAEVKKVARVLLERLKQLLVINWRQKASARSQIRLVIEDVLDSGLPRAYDKLTYDQKCSELFEHVYESYPERNSGVYARAG